MMKLKVLNETFFKLSTAQARELNDTQKILVKDGTEFEVLAHLPAEHQHVKATLKAALGPEGRNTWYIYSNHVEVAGNLPNNNPQESAVDGPPKQGAFKLPGYTSTFYLSEPVLKGANFTWAEATKNGTRIPVTKGIVSSILSITDTMEEIRQLFGNRPITVTSWYRDPESNRRVGGASQSRHLTGGAVDFYIAGVSPDEVQRRLDPWWGNRGGLASASGFTHIDNRGYKARWRYGA